MDMNTDVPPPQSEPKQRDRGTMMGDHILDVEDKNIWFYIKFNKFLSISVNWNRDFYKISNHFKIVLRSMM